MKLFALTMAASISSSQCHAMLSANTYSEALEVWLCMLELSPAMHDTHTAETCQDQLANQLLDSGTSKQRPDQSHHLFHASFWGGCTGTYNHTCCAALGCAALHAYLQSASATSISETQACNQVHQCHGISALLDKFYAKMLCHPCRGRRGTCCDASC